MSSIQLQLKIINQPFQLGVILRIDELGGFEEGLGMLLHRLGHRLAPCADEPVGDVDVGFHVFGGGVLLQEGADGDVETPGQARGDGGQIVVLGQFFGPLLVAIDVGERDNLPVGQDEEPVVDAGLAAGGQPDVFRYEACADDGCLFGFDQRHRLLGLLPQQMFAKEALREVPGRRQLPG